MKASNEKIQAITEWSSTLTGETEPFPVMMRDYLWPEVIKKLRDTLPHCKGRMVCISGLQGVGKTAAMTMLGQTMRGEAIRKGQENHEETAHSRVFYFKWPRNGDWWEAVWHASEATFLDFGRKVNVDRLTTQERRNSVHTYVSKMLKENQTIIVDLGDYSRKDARLMNHDIDRIQDLWNAMLEASKPAPNLVMFIQKELYKGHFFLGKFEHIELKPFTAEELVQAYKNLFDGQTYPFKDEALLELARMSRGIFRRFKKYVHKCVGDWLSRQRLFERIAVADVQRVISFDEVAADMELQLSDLFAKAGQRTLAIHIMEHLRLNPETNQTELAKVLDVDPGALSRMVSQLEMHGYVTSRRGEHGEKKLIPLLFATGIQLRDIMSTILQF